MTRHLRTLSAVILSVLLILTGHGLAASRGMSAATGQMVICTGTGPVVVYMDETGQPTRPPHYCPDYALSLMGALADAVIGLPDAPDRALPGPSRARTSLALMSARIVRARGPPASV